MISRESKTSAQQRQRRYHRKVKTGCDCCRARKIRCDENRPVCSNCIRVSRRCEGSGYGSNSDTPSETITTESLSLATSSDILPPSIVGGNVEPFNIFCVGSSPMLHQKIFDHTIHSQWSLYTASSRQTALAVVKKDVMSVVIHSPVAYYTFLYAGACHLLFSGGHIVQRADVMRFKNQALHEMQSVIQSEGPNLSEETLLSMVLLAAHGAADKLERRELGNVQSRKLSVLNLNAEYWCALDTEWQHVNIFYKMMKQSGKRSLSPGSLWTATVLFDIFNAYMHLRLPQLDALIPLSACFDLRRWESDEIALHLIRNTCQRFAEVFVHMPDTSLQQIVHGFVLVMADLDHFQRSKIPNIVTVVLMKSMCIREVLLLPETISDLRTEVLASIYQLCRLSCLLCCATWLYAYVGQNHEYARNLPRRLVQALRPVLDRSVGVMVNKWLPDFYLWIVMMGLMLAYEDFDNTSDGASIRLLIPCLEHLDVELSPSSWPTIKGRVSQFLWCEQVCDLTAEEAWELACEINIDHTYGFLR